MDTALRRGCFAVPGLRGTGVSPGVVWLREGQRHSEYVQKSDDSQSMAMESKLAKVRGHKGKQEKDRVADYGPGRSRTVGWHQGTR